MPLPHWYELASPEDRREYDAFGPWILEVTTEDLMPPRFRSLWPDWQGGEFLYKIPVDRERRAARPGEVLYDRIVAVKDGRLGLFTVEKGEVRSRIVPLAEVVALRSAHILLRGEFSVFLRGGDGVTLVYNTVSRPLVEKLMDYLRSGLPGRLDQVPPGAPDVPVADYAFLTLVRRHRQRRPGCRIAACLEPGQPCRDDRNRKRRTSGLLVLDAGGETVLLDTGPSPHKVREAVYASRCTVLSHGAPTDLRVEGQTLVAEAGGHRFTWPLFGDTTALDGYLKNSSRT
jgi:hypothetical protein